MNLRSRQQEILAASGTFRVADLSASRGRSAIGSALGAATRFLREASDTSFSISMI